MVLALPRKPEMCLRLKARRWDISNVGWRLKSGAVRLMQAKCGDSY